ISVPFPTPRGWPKKLSSEHLFGHKYEKSVSAGPDSSSLAEPLRNEVIADPTPGHDKPATREGTPNDATPPGGLVGTYGQATGGAPVKSYIREVNGKR